MDSNQILELANSFAKEAKKKKNKKWVQKAVKRPGRFKGWDMARMKSRYRALKKKEKKSKSEISEMRALALGIRFKGGDVPGGKKRKGLKGKKSFYNISHLYKKYAGELRKEGWGPERTRAVELLQQLAGEIDLEFRDHFHWKGLPNTAAGALDSALTPAVVRDGEPVAYWIPENTPFTPTKDSKKGIFLMMKGDKGKYMSETEFEKEVEAVINREVTDPFAGTKAEELITDIEPVDEPEPESEVNPFEMTDEEYLAWKAKQ